MNDIIKIAEEYDAAGRIMARAFYEEFNKLAACGPKAKFGTGRGVRRGKRKKGKASGSGAIHMFMQD